MRKKTIAGISLLLAIGINLLFNGLAGPQGLEVPYVGFVSSLIAIFVAAAILGVLLTFFNKRILAWRKAHGRDIEAEEREEERYVNEAADIVSLRPNTPEK